MFLFEFRTARTANFRAGIGFGDTNRSG